MDKEKPCAFGHTWTNQYGGDGWEPERGTLCDCGQKKWGIPQSIAREHEWQFYANGSFCRRCGVGIGSSLPCR